MSRNAPQCLRAIASGLLFLLATGCATPPDGDWQALDAAVQTAIEAGDWRAARAPARALPALYERQAAAFDPALYVALAQQAAEVEGHLGYALAAIGVLEDAERRLTGAGLAGDPALDGLYADLVPLYTLTRRTHLAIAAFEKRLRLDLGPQAAFDTRLAFFDWARREGVLDQGSLEAVLDDAAQYLDELPEDFRHELVWRRLVLDLRGLAPQAARKRLESLAETLATAPDGESALWRVLASLAALDARLGEEAALAARLKEIAALDLASARRTPVLAPAPDYGRAARATALIAEVRLSLDVDADGRVTAARIIESNANRALGEDLLRAVRTGWRFAPGLADGVAVPRHIDGLVFRDFAPNHWRAHAPPAPSPGSNIRRRDR
ncbi:MAG: TonB family protein [Alphaproteobacteria bacterium]|nr:MAG: TonB family protein [Alphaproteobacteria bacterium]